jgi:hypothetical protein
MKKHSNRRIGFRAVFSVADAKKKLGDLLPSILFIMIMLTCVPAHAVDMLADIYVAPDGNDAWPGSLPAPNGKGEGPVATLTRAAQIIREKRAALNGRPKGFTVLVRGGTYYLSSPVIFTSQDSGDEGAPVVYAAYPGEHPVFSGGQPLRGFVKDAEGRWQLDIPEVKSSQWYFTQLFVNDQRRFRPRLPKTGYYKIDREVPASPQVARMGYDRFGYSGSDINPDWHNLQDVTVTAFQEWTAAELNIKTVDAADHAVQLRGWTKATDFYKFKPGYRYRVENVKEALSKPGEWYLDRATGHLTYIPRAGEEIQSARVSAPKLEHLLILTNYADSGKPVANIKFQGLTFAQTAWPQRINAATGGQGGISTTSAAIAAVGAVNVTFDEIAVRNIGGYAMALGPGCQSDKIINSAFADLGAGGINIGDIITSYSIPQMLNTTTDPRVTGNLVQNNLITGGGRINPAGIGIWVGKADHITVANNEVSDFYYTGISVGWTWGYDESKTSDNHISRNLVHTIGQHVLSDMAGIYTLGVQPGTEISDNIIHDVDGFRYGGFAIALDEGSSNLTVQRNLTYNTSHGGYSMNFGRDNVITDNVFAGSPNYQLTLGQGQSFNSLTFTRNIVYFSGAGKLAVGPWPDLIANIDSNIYWNNSTRQIRTFADQVKTGTTVVTGTTPWLEWRTQHHHEAHSLIADPLFKNPAAGDFTLPANSPARKLNMQPLPTEAGRTTKIDLMPGLPPVPKAFD